MLHNYKITNLQTNNVQFRKHIKHTMKGIKTFNIQHVSLFQMGTSNGNIIYAITIHKLLSVTRNIFYEIF